MAIVVWVGAVAVLAAIFWPVWRLAVSIERAEAEERAWEEYLQYLWQVDPYQAQYWEWVRSRP